MLTADKSTEMSTDVRGLQDSGLFREQCYIGDQWVGEPVTAVYSPHDWSLLGKVPQFGTEETRQAILAAESALPDWRSRSAKERSDLIERWADLCLQHQTDLARILTLEQGKPLAEARGEILYGTSFLHWFAGEARRINGDVISANSRHRRIMTLKQPVGVVAAITPWNFPNAMITRKAGAALAAGCTIIVKPATETPFSALALAELAHRAGIPSGVFNVVTGNSRAIGAELTSNKAVRKLTFTGSTEIGRILLRQCADTVKKVSMELGGNAPFIVFEDADLDKAVEGVMISKYRNAGQTCVCANRIYVHEAIYDIFTEKLAAAVSALVVGSGLDEGVTIGPLINTEAIKKVRLHIDDAVRRGATVHTGGASHAAGELYFQPTILTNIGADSLLLNDETFGPIAPLIRFSDEAEVVVKANDTESGLAAYFYTRDIGRIWRVAEALEYGMLGINDGLISTEVAPFGGVKESGLGREGSKYGIEDYLEIKYLSLDIS